MKNNDLLDQMSSFQTNIELIFSTTSILGALLISQQQRCKMFHSFCFLDSFLQPQSFTCPVICFSIYETTPSFMIIKNLEAIHICFLILNFKSICKRKKEFLLLLYFISETWIEYLFQLPLTYHRALNGKNYITAAP